MCLDCGCHDYDNCHGDIRHITNLNVYGAVDANNGTMSLEQVANNVKDGLDDLVSGKSQLETQSLGNRLSLKIGFDVDETITSAPVVMAAISHALRQQGHKIYVITGHGPAETRAELLRILGFEYDELVVLDPKDDGSGKADYIQTNHIDFMFDNKDSFGPAISRVCPVTFMYDKPPATSTDLQTQRTAQRSAAATKTLERFSVSVPVEQTPTGWVIADNLTYIPPSS